MCSALAVCRVVGASGLRVMTLAPLVKAMPRWLRWPEDGAYPFCPPRYYDPLDSHLYWIDEERRAVDWIFRYGNPALARLEKLPLEKLIGSSFGSLFSNMNTKWLRLYERAVLYGETLEVMDYSPEIDAYLKVTCFPTFKGHCGCILFDLTEIEYAKISPDADKALMRYFGKARERDSEA